MDLAKFDVREDAATLHLRDPIHRRPIVGDDGQPVTIDLVSIYSRRGTQVRYAMASQALLLAGENGEIDPERASEQTARRLAELTTGWSSNLIVDGAAIEFSEDAARRLYERFDWVRVQADAFVNNRAKHLGNSSASSSPSPAASSHSPSNGTDQA